MDLSSRGRQGGGGGKDKTRTSSGTELIRGIYSVDGEPFHVEYRAFTRSMLESLAVAVDRQDIVSIEVMDDQIWQRIDEHLLSKYR